MFLVRTQVGPPSRFVELSVSIQASFAILQTLRVVDRRIEKLESELAKERAGISDKTERYAALQSKIKKIEAMVLVMEGTRNELNQELRQHLLQSDKAREKMARCRNEREANAVQREMEEVRRLCRERELEIQKLAGLITDARSDAEAIQQEISEVTGQIDETEGLAAQKVRDLEDRLEEEQKKRKSALDQLPKTVQRRYGAVHAKRGTGTAQVIDGSCAACHISLSPMLYQELMRMQEFFQCPSCHHLLYVSETGAEPGLSSEDESSADEDESSAASEG